MAINDYLQGINNATAGQTADVKTASNDLSTLQTGAGALPAKLKEALNLKLNNNKDIINQQSATMENYFNSGAQAREKYQDVFNPFEKAKLVQQDRSMALRPYDTLSGVLENRMGTVADTVTAGVQGWQGLVNAATTKLGTAKDMLSTALQSYLSAADQQSAADDMAYKIAAAEEASRQFEQNYGLDLMKRNDQVSQFAQSLGLKSSGTNDKVAKLTDEKLQEAMSAAANPDGSINEWKMHNYIQSHRGAWENLGVNMAIIDKGHKTIAEQYPSGKAPTNTVTLDPNSFAANQINLSTGKLPETKQKNIPTVLKPGDPGYADMSAISAYLRGNNVSANSLKLGGK